MYPLHLGRLRPFTMTSYMVDWFPNSSFKKDRVVEHPSFVSKSRVLQCIILVLFISFVFSLAAARTHCIPGECAPTFVVVRSLQPLSDAKASLWLLLHY